MNTQDGRATEGESFDVHGIRFRLETDCVSVRELVRTTYEAFGSRVEDGDEIVLRLLSGPDALRLTD